MLKRITILTAHFGDFDWTEFLLKRIDESVASCRYDIQLLVINQDRTQASRERLLKMRAMEVLEYPKNEEYFSLMRHDHPWVLDQALEEVMGDILVVFDSDAHPIQVHLDDCGLPHKWHHTFPNNSLSTLATDPE